MCILCSISHNTAALGPRFNTDSIEPLPLSIIEPDKILPFIAPVNSDLYRVSQNQLEKLDCEVYPGILSKGIDFLRMGQCEDDIESSPERELISQAGGSLKGPWYTGTL